MQVTPAAETTPPPSGPLPNEQSPSGPSIERVRLHLRGTVQGVGFRPYCVQQARALGLSGHVRNGADGLWVEAQGPGPALEILVRRLRDQPPPLARVDDAHRWALAPMAPFEATADFVILDSDTAAASNTHLPADAASCPACLDELFDPHNRRYRYPFINCTHCGPRYTIVDTLPYDRARTSMARFTLCPQCAAEYADPGNRRHHAQPNACSDCGPRLSWRDAHGQPLAVEDPITAAVAALCQGAIVAVLGIGGYQLLCCADNEAAVLALRTRKARPSKPLAVMSLNTASLQHWLLVDDAAKTLLESPARPIVLLPRRAAPHSSPAAAATDADLDQWLAPGLGEWGAMLPVAPLHWLLFHEWLGRPPDPTWRSRACTALWVATSANPSGEPLLATPTEAHTQLAGIADFFLDHDRPILARCDDSVLRAAEPGSSAAPAMIRRARGYVPNPIELHGVDEDAPTVLACGGWLKNTICLTRGREAFLSTHIGDLGTRASRAALDENLGRLQRFLGVRPAAIAHDLHPDFYSSQRAQQWAEEWNIPALGVQHHHAHLAAIRAEHALTADLLHGWILDGYGYGEDGGAWGAEWLALAADGQLQPLAALPTLPMPGGEIAAREPWRIATALLHGLQVPANAECTSANQSPAQRFRDQPMAAALTRQLAQGAAARFPQARGAGRYFDTAAALLGLCPLNRYEGEAAMRLEAAAQRALHRGAEQTAAHSAAPSPLWTLRDGKLDFTPLWRALALVDPQDIYAVDQAALDFHHHFAQALATLSQSKSSATESNPLVGSTPLALGGGCAINQVLRQQLRQALHPHPVLEAHAAPAGDGGLALGQAWVAIRRLQCDAHGLRR